MFNKIGERGRTCHFDLPLPDYRWICIYLEGIYSSSLAL